MSYEFSRQKTCLAWLTGNNCSQFLSKKLNDPGLFSGIKSEKNSQKKACEEKQKTCWVTDQRKTSISNTSKYISPRVSLHFVNKFQGYTFPTRGDECCPDWQKWGSSAFQTRSNKFWHVSFTNSLEIKEPVSACQNKFRLVWTCLNLHTWPGRMAENAFKRSEK